jgi:hypothetical protein
LNFANPQHQIDSATHGAVAIRRVRIRHIGPFDLIRERLPPGV